MMLADYLRRATLRCLFFSSHDAHCMPLMLPHAATLS